MRSAGDIRKIARSVLAVARALGTVDDLLDRLQLIAGLFRESKPLRHLLITRRIATGDKLAILRKTFGGTLGELEYGALELLVEKQLGAELPELAGNIARLAAAEAGRLPLTITSAEALPAEQASRMADSLAESLGRPVRVSAHTDPALLGGLKLRLGNTLVDGSLARRLEKVRQGLA